MFKKILIAEDIDSISLGVINLLDTFKNVEIHHSKYCDDALLKIKRALHDHQPFDLLISDLSFKEDHKTPSLKSGEELIEQVKKIQPEIKIIIYSIEDRAAKIRKLLDNGCADGYVPKGRNSTEELKKAMQYLHNHDNRYLPSDLNYIMQSQDLFEIETYDIALITLLSQGMSQDEMGDALKKQGYLATSKSSIEKRINRLKTHFEARNMAHLVSLSKDIGLI